MACMQGQQTGQQAGKQEEQSEKTEDSGTKYHRRAPLIFSVCHWPLRCHSEGASQVMLDTASELTFIHSIVTPTTCPVGAICSGFTDLSFLSVLFMRLLYRREISTKFRPRQIRLPQDANTQDIKVIIAVEYVCCRSIFHVLLKEHSCSCWT